MNIMVGCPAYKREWVLPAWFDHVERAFKHVDLEPHYVFVLNYGDEESRRIIFDRSNKLTATFVDQEDPPTERTWNDERYAEMVSLRNTLLRQVRSEQPDYFLSLDSDILLAEEVMPTLLETIQNFDAVGGKCFLSASSESGYGVTDCPSYGNLKSDGQLLRPDTAGVIPVGVIMAIKLMSPEAYAIDYKVSQHGEDIGWSLNCAEAGLKLAFDGRVINKHIMSVAALNRIDHRVGW